MRVLFVTHNAPRRLGDAPGSFVLRLATGLAARGVSVRLLAPHAAGLAEQDTLEGIPVRRVRYADEADETLAYTGTMAQQVADSWRGKRALLGLLRALRRAVREEAAQVDVVHAHWWFPAGLSAAFAARAGRPLVVTLHGSDVRLARGALAGGLFRAVAQRAAAVTAVSSWLADETVRLTGAARPRVAPMPIDRSRFAPAGAARDGLLFVGKLDAQKGLHVLLDALPHIVAARGPLTVIGDGPDRAALQAQAQQLGVADRVRWLGALPQPALVPHYQQAGAVILPASAPEGLGLVAIEARACGAPIVASAIGGLVDVAGDRDTARLVPPGDARALADAINTLPPADENVTDPRVAAFAPEAVAASYVALYEEVRRDARA